MLEEYTISVDIAKKSDYTAIQIYRKKAIIVPGKKLLGQRDMKINKFDLVKMEKIQGANYNAIAQRILLLATVPNLLGKCDIIVDGTGVGEAVVDIMRELKLRPISIVFTGGNEYREVYDSPLNVFGNKNTRTGGMQVLKQINVPKKDLVDAAVLVLQQGLLRFSPGVMYKEDFLLQLSKFKGKINEKGNTRYEADKESTHDDLVASFLMFAWWQHYQEPREREEIEEENNYGFNEEADMNFKLF
jgi:hypothetical protein